MENVFPVSSKLMAKASLDARTSKKDSRGMNVFYANGDLLIVV